MLEHCCRYLLPFSHTSISEVCHWCWAIRPDSQSAFQFIPKVLYRVEIRVLCRPVKFFHNDLNKSFMYGLALCTGALSCWNRKGPSPNCCHNVGSTESSRMSLYCIVALRFPFTGTNGPSQNNQNSPRPVFLPHQTLPLALCIGAGSVLLASTKPRFIHRTARWWSLIHHSRQTISTAPESNGGDLNITPAADAWQCAWS